MKWVTIKDIYEECVSRDVPLLSNGFTGIGDYWTLYTENHNELDAFLARRYKSFRYYAQTPISRFAELTSEDIATATTAWLVDCKMWLQLNDKKYDELYRVNVLENTDYDIIDNYSITEIMEKETSHTDNDTFGARSDSNNDTFGSRTDGTNDTIGQRTDESTEQVAGFNSVSFDNADKTSLVTGQQSNSRSFSKGQQSDTHSFSKGQQQDSHVGSGTEDYTLTRKGNIGVKTVSEILQEHVDFWNTWDFYLMIFRDINKELLLV